MLQVNTAQISIEELAVKYGLRLRELFPGLPYSYDYGTNLHVSIETGELTVSTEGAGDTCYEGSLDLLCDMILSHDIIKTERPKRCLE